MAEPRIQDKGGAYSIEAEIGRNALKSKDAELGWAGMGWVGERRTPLNRATQVFVGRRRNGNP